ncbi:UPF0481 protein [Prunus yedoensis var. nudiflora]|uniref:UPF0481 protein n=1 Tax=Prunus yedoensis var. nudiflora TaxID=2094558 RepID=A0A314UYN4_PRUYE|nr:UPF0481 protein [Prunus yedoensis var. nudiflora]
MEGDRGKCSIVDGESTSIIINDAPTVEDLKKNIEAQLLSHSPLLSSCCIFKVPEVIRRQKEHAYEPNIVSIGPFHRGNEKFQLFEDVKRWYLHCLLDSSKDVLTLESLIKVIMELAKSARACYVADPLHGDLNPKDFVEMMILDGCFLLELFRKARYYDLQNENDPVFNVSCMLEHLYHDLLLLENQLPWSVLERLYNLTANRPSQRCHSLTSLVLNFFRQSDVDNLMLNPNFELPDEILHILDLIRAVIVFKETPSVEKQQNKEGGKGKCIMNIFKNGVFTKAKTRKGSNLSHRIPNATSLSEAGVRFEKSQNKEEGKGECIMNIKFKDGVFTIPPLGIDEKTEPLFRNLIAFEQCYHDRSHKITSYAVLMDNLIDSREDIDFLCDKGILANWLNPDDAAQFFNKLYDDTSVMGYYYSGLSDDVNTYYKTKWHKFMETLRRDYFSTPWRIVSFIAAFILLVLTLVQTLYTIRWP